MARIINVNKELEALFAEPHPSGNGFYLNISDSRDYIDYFEEGTYSISVECKKRLTGGYRLYLLFSYTSRDGVKCYKKILNPHIPIKLKSDMLEYSEWVIDKLNEAFEGDWYF